MFLKRQVDPKLWFFHKGFEHLARNSELDSTFEVDKICVWMSCCRLMKLCIIGWTQ